MAKNENQQTGYVSAGIVIVVNEAGEFLLVQEGREEAKEGWNLPGGMQNKGEDIRTCAERECLEETGFQVKVSREIGTYKQSVFLFGHKTNIICIVYKAEIMGGELTRPEKPGEIMDVGWFSIKAIRKLKEEGNLILPYIWEAIQAYIKEDKK